MEVPKKLLVPWGDPGAQCTEAGTQRDFKRFERRRQRRQRRQRQRKGERQGPEMVIKCFWYLLHGCSIYDLLNLFDFDKLLTNVYLFSADSKSVCNPDADDLPWPVLLLLGGFSRKFRFAYPRKLRSVLLAIASSRSNNDCCGVSAFMALRHSGGGGSPTRPMHRLAINSLHPSFGFLSTNRRCPS